MREAAASIVRRLRAAGHEAYLVGGCVRDLLLGREPKDWDVATAARPDEMQPLFQEVVEVGRHFGVLRVRCGEHWIEVATFRSEGAYSDGRHPDSVRFTDARADAQRRDFTVNALLLDPETERVIDFVGGKADLDARLLRAVGAPRQRFAEDALRLLRAVRLACKLGFEIEAVTWEGMRQEAARIRTTSAERIRDEFLQILTGPAPRRGLLLLQQSGLLHEILPEIEALQGVGQPPRYHPEGDVWEHTLRMLDGMRSPSPELALAVLLHDVGKPATRTEEAGEIRFYGHVEKGQEIARRVLERLRLPARTCDEVVQAIGQHMRFLDVERMKKSTLRRFVLQDGFPEILELHRLDAASSNGDLSSWERCRAERDRLASEPLVMRPLLSGHDLQALGHAPGPQLGVILRALVDAQLEGQVADAPAAVEWVRTHYPPAPPGATGPRAAGDRQAGDA